MDHSQVNPTRWDANLSHLDRHEVRVLHRDLEEILASQNTMLERRGEQNPISDANAEEAYRKHIIDTKVFLRTRPNFELLEVGYTEVHQSGQHGAY